MRTEERLLELFFEEPTKHCHFDELLKNIEISRPQLNYWLKKELREKIISRIKAKGKMPYYTANYKNLDYQNKKRLFALSKLEDVGLLKYLSGLEKAKTIILFGSMSRWDWYKDSDIDIFIYGDDENINIKKYRAELHREIQIFKFKNKYELKKINQPLLKNILEGYKIKGNLDFIEEVKINA